MKIVTSDDKFFYEDKISEIQERVIYLNKRAEMLQNKDLLADSQKVSLRASRWGSLLRQDMMKRQGENIS